MSSEWKPKWLEQVDPRSDAEPRARVGPTGYRRAWLVAILVVSCSVVWMHATVGGPWATLVFSNVSLSITAFAATAALGLLTLRSEAPDRLGWGLVAVGAGCDVLGELSWTGYELIAGEVPYPGLPDLFYLAGYPFVAAGLLVLTLTRHRTGSTLRIGLDGGLVAVALLTVSWHVVLEPMLAAAAVDRATLLVSVAYPTLDIVVGSIAFTVAANARGPRRVPITLLAAGVFAWVFGDSVYLYLSLNGGYVYNVFDALWVAGYLAIALAALHPAAATSPIAADRRRYEFWETVAPYAPFLLAMGITGYAAATGDLGRIGFGLAAAALVVLVARQSYVFHDASVLSRRLETNEATLGKRNEELVLLNRIVRHDIRNDMAVVLGWGSELETRVDDDEREMLERMLNTTRHTVELTETLQAFSEAWDSDGSHEITAISLRKTLLETVERRREGYADVEFVVGPVPDVDVRASPLLSTVFRNLLNNAVQHNDAAEPRIEVTADADEDAETVRVRVSDNGSGIPLEQRDVVFGRGEKGLESEGSGVGLYLVDTLVAQYGGDVRIESNEAGGAVFVVELRRCRD